jgi:hypothetical protein
VLITTKLRILLAVPVLLSTAGTSAAEDLFAMRSFESRGRSVAANLAELNGDGRVDLFVVALNGIPPEEERMIGVYLQRADGELPAVPDHRIAVPPWSTVYDVADLRADLPGEELIVLQPDGVTLLSLASADAPQIKLLAPGPTSVGLADDERGFEPYRLIDRSFGDEPWILVPQIGQLTALSPTGEVRARIAVPRRANYFIIPETGMVTIESDFQIFLDVPRLAVGDVNGDGAVDFVSSTRHEIRIFHRREDGGYDYEPSEILPLRRVTPRDHIRGSGGVASDSRDIDGDGKLDLAVAHVRGSFSDATTSVHIHMNKGSGWDLETPDQTLVTRGSVGSASLVDLNGDGVSELLRLGLSFSLLELVELLLTKELDVEISVHHYDPIEEMRRDDLRVFREKPSMKEKIAVPFSFKTFRPRGFIPVANVDLNADGYLDFASSGGGRAIHVMLGGEWGLFDQRGGRQEMATAGVIHYADYNLDGLPDFVIFDPHNFDVPVRVGINRGVLPGTPRRAILQPSP